MKGLTLMLVLSLLLHGTRWVVMNGLDALVSIALAVVANALCGLDRLRRGTDDADEQAVAT